MVSGLPRRFAPRNDYLFRASLADAHCRRLEKVPAGEVVDPRSPRVVSRRAALPWMAGTAGYRIAAHTDPALQRNHGMLPLGSSDATLPACLGACQQPHPIDTLRALCQAMQGQAMPGSRA